MEMSIFIYGEVIMNLKHNKSLDIRYSMIHGLYWMTYCTMMGYASVFLLHKGFNNSLIGVILAVSNIIATVAQPALATYVDRTNKISLKNLIAIIVSGVIGFSISVNFLKSPSIILIAVIIIVFTLTMSLQPLINSLSFEFESHGYEVNFGLARGIGSVSYAVISLILGYIVEKYNPDILPIFYVVLTIGLVILIYTFSLPKGAKSQLVHERHYSRKGSNINIIGFCKKYKKFMVFLLGVICIFLDHTIINNFFIQIMTNVGGNSKDMGNAIFLAAVLELPTMSLFFKIKEKISCRKLLVISSAAFTIKHIITYFASSVAMIYVAQVVQVAGYALFIPASVYYVSRLIDKSDMVKGQALVTGAITVSGVFASLSGGILIDTLGVSSMLLIGAIVSVIGTILIFFTIEEFN